MKTKFNYQGIHSCEAAVVTCIDFRFWRNIVKFVEEDLGIKDFDFPSIPGAAKAINDCPNDQELALKCVGIPCNLHHVKKIVIVNHWDCGAYGGSKNFKNAEDEQTFHESELKKAKEKVLKYYPHQEVILALAKITDDGKSVDFLMVS